MEESKKKREWERIGVIVSLLGVVVSLTFSILNYCQRNEAEKKNEKRHLETKRELEIEKMKNTAREWFSLGEYNNSFEHYKKVIELDSADSEGYQKFLDIGNSLKANKKDWQYEPAITIFFERAEQLKPIK